MKVSENFDIREFVPIETYNRWRAKSIWFVRPEIISIAEFYKVFFKNYFKADNVLVTVNNYMFGGQLQYRGYRPPSCTIGAGESQHRFGSAFDCSLTIIKGNQRSTPSYADVQAALIYNEKEIIKAGITTIEDTTYTPTWLHTDIRNTGLDHLLIVKP